MKFSRSAVIGSLTGWFVLSPLVFPNCYPLIMRLMDASLGILTAIILGIIFGHIFGSD